MRGSHMPMYTHDRSRRRKGVNIAEVVAGVLGVILLILVIGAFSSQTPSEARRASGAEKPHGARPSPISFYTLTSSPSARSEPESLQLQGDAEAPA